MNRHGELLGLPGSGKSFILERLVSEQGDMLQATAVPSGRSVKKIFHMLRGISVIGPQVLPFLPGIMARRNRGAIKLVFVLLERTGRLQNNRLTGGVMDEGVLQALWGLLFRLNDRTTTRLSEAVLVSLRSEIGVVYYVRCFRSLHREFMESRRRINPGKFILSDHMALSEARHAMAVLLRRARLHALTIRLINNRRG